MFWVHSLEYNHGCHGVNVSVITSASDVSYSLPVPEFFLVLLKSRIHMECNNTRGILKGYEN